MADELNNGQQVQSTEGHESEQITVAGLKAALQKFKTDKVDPMQWPMLSVIELPTASVSTMHKIYLVPSINAEQNNAKDEFITISATSQDVTTYSWEQIGSTTVDLSSYATLQNVANTFADVRADGVAVVTLSSAPTSSTTTYTKDGQTVNFKVSDEVRVADTEQSTEGSHGYVYYKLYDLVNGVAYWDLMGSGGETVFGKITASITPYVNDIASSASLLGNVTVTLTNTTDSTTVETKTWNGTDVTFEDVMPLKDYRVSVEDKTGWLRDKSYVDITNVEIADERTASFSYSADEYTCVVTGTSDGRIVVSGTEYANGATFRVSKGTSITATAKAVTNFVTPTATITNKTISAVYVAYGYVTVSTSSNQGTDSTIAAVTPTIKIGDAAAVSYTAPVQVAPSTEVVITWPAVTGYKAPAQITFTKNGTTDETKSGEYQTELVTVTVDTDETGVTAEGQIITINGSNYTVGASGVVTAKVPFDTVYSVSANAWSGQDDYTTPESQTNITAAIASRNITMTYLKIRGTLYSLIVTDNQSGASGAASNANITVKYIKDNVETILGTTFKNGDTFLIPNDATNITITGSSITYFAASTTVSGTTYTVTYKAQKVTVTISGGGTGCYVNLSDGTRLHQFTSTGSYYVPWGKSWSISATPTTSKYPSSISSSSGTANSASKSVSVTFSNYTLVTSGEADLGLPSGKLWAAANVGSSSYYAWGKWFSWGDTTGHLFSEQYNFNSTNYNSGANGSGHNLTGDIPSGNATYDAARANMSGTWRIPTKAEYEELLDSSNTTWFYASLENTGGQLVISKNNSKGIYLPNTGYMNGTTHNSSGANSGYYISTKYYSSNYFYHLKWQNSSRSLERNMYRYYGFQVRAIKDPKIEAVDMTPSNTGGRIYWATGNLTKDANGNYKIADNPWDYGAYFSWGNTDGHRVAGQTDSYSFNSTTYSSTTGNNLTADIASGSTTYDAARAKLGGSWRVPTYDEIQSLKNNCTWNWKASGNSDYSGVAGYEVYCANTGNKIFLPCAGRYDGSSLYEDGTQGFYWSTKYYSSTGAYYFHFFSTNKTMRNNTRYCGQSIRPVYTVTIMP